MSFFKIPHGRAQCYINLNKTDVLKVNEMFYKTYFNRKLICKKKLSRLIIFLIKFVRLF